MKIRALIVDDEALGRRGVLRFLKNDPDVEVVAQCGDGQSAVGAILGSNPDLVFLDIQMPEMDGFEVIRRVGPQKMPVTVFVTPTIATRCALSTRMQSIISSSPWGKRDLRGPLPEPKSASQKAQKRM